MGRKVNLFQRTMPSCTYTHHLIPWPGVVRYGYRREIRRGLITPWALVCPRNSTNGQQRGKLVGYTNPSRTGGNR